jgi:hypothetical protein
MAKKTDPNKALRKREFNGVRVGVTLRDIQFGKTTNTSIPGIIKAGSPVYVTKDKYDVNFYRACGHCIVTKNNIDFIKDASQKDIDDLVRMRNIEAFVSGYTYRSPSSC